jgi:hypothetical protein
MNSSVYISSEKIEVIGYTKSGKTAAVSDYLTYPLPEECVLNGKIIDVGPVAEGVSALKSAKPDLFKDVSLIIDGSFILSKKVVIPGKLDKKRYDQVIRDEFAEVAENIKQLICDYVPLSTGGDGSKTILAFAVGREQIDAYLSIFKSADIKLSAIRIGAKTIIQYINARADLKDMTFVLNVVDGEAMLSMIFDQGVNTFLSRTRLYGEDRAELVQSTLGGLSGFIQFNKSQNLGEITHCFYLGLSQAEMNLVELQSAYHNIEFAALDIYKGSKGTDALPTDAHFAYLNTTPPKEGNLLDSIKALEKAVKKDRPKKLWIPAAAIVALLLLTPLTYLGLQVGGIEKEIKMLNEYLNLEEIKAKSAEMDALLAETMQIRMVVGASEQVIQADAALPRVTKPFMETILRTGGTTTIITDVEFSESSGTVRIAGNSPTENDAANYVEALKRENEVEGIFYTGYHFDSRARYHFTAEIVIAERGGSE